MNRSLKMLKEFVHSREQTLKLRRGRRKRAAPFFHSQQNTQDFTTFPVTPTLMESDRWFRVYFTLNEVQDGLHIMFLHDFASVYVQAAGPIELASFRDNRLSEGAAYYLSPAASRYCPAILEFYAFVHCERPSMDSVSLGIGRTEAIKTYFMERAA